MSDQAVRQAVARLGGQVVLSAGAGTGKTYTLVEVFVHLVIGASAVGKRVEPTEIVALTFTDKAAAELRERVRARLGQLAALSELPVELLAACQAAGVGAPTPAELRVIADRAQVAPIGTFHAFAGELVRRHAARLGLDPELTLMSDDEAQALARQLGEEVVLARLDDPAVQAVLAELGLGSRRRNGLVSQLVNLAGRLDEEGRTPGDLLVMSDVEPPARQAFDLARDAWRSAYLELTEVLAAGDGKGVYLQQRERLRAGERARLAFLEALPADEDPGREPWLMEVKAQVALNLGARRPERKAARDALEVAFDAMVLAHATVRSARLALPFIELLTAFRQALAAEKRRLGVLDFGDLLRLTRQLLDLPAVRGEVQAGIAALLVDEFQDTSPVQKQILDRCRAPGVPLLLVGDRKQSIYEFRGADVTVFSDAMEETRRAGGQVLALTVSRRARRPLVAAQNRLFLHCMRGERGAFDVAFDEARDALEAHRSDGEEGQALTLVDADQQRGPWRTAQLVRELVDPPGLTGERKPRWRDVVILLARFTRLDRYTQALRQAGVPHHVVGGRGFFEAQEVRDLAHALALFDDPRDGLSTLAVLRSPLVGLSDVSILGLARATPRGRLSLQELVGARWPELPAGEGERLRDYLRLFAELDGHVDRLGAAGVMSAICEATDLAAVLAASPHGEQRVANLERLLDEVRARDARGLSRAATTRWLGERVLVATGLEGQAQILSEQDDVVRIMTIHQAKGLEFPVVIVPECGAPMRPGRGEGLGFVYDRAAGLGLRARGLNGPLASARARLAVELRLRRLEAESLRLFYVACTRAKDDLVLVGEAGRKGRSWRTIVDEWVAGDLMAAPLLRRHSPRPAAAVAAQPPLIEQDLVALRAPLSAVLEERLAPPSTGAATLVAPVTVLADLEACALRFHLRHELGLDDHPAARTDRSPPADPDDAERLPEGLELDAQARGVLAHRLLERLDLQAFRARGESALHDLLADEGYGAPLGDDVKQVLVTVLAFLAGPTGRDLLARADGVRRELPFLFAPRGEGPRLLVKGQIDLVLEDPAGVVVLDYKLARKRGAQAPAYAFQIGVYAAAARALFGKPVRAGLIYLLDKQPGAELRRFSDDDLDAIEARLAALGARLAEVRRLAVFPRIERPACEQLGCGYVTRCHGAAPPSSEHGPSKKGKQLTLFG
jgi:ATP-dependent exoDNAse (exonuclease V) beta subunit